MVDIITEKMEKGQTRKKHLESISNVRLDFVKCFYIAMIVIAVIIAIILVDLIRKNNDKVKNEIIKTNYDIANLDIKLNEDEGIDRFIRDYFNARSNLNYQKIFSVYGRDYYKEEWESKDDSLKKIIDNIRYEKIFVKSYDDIKIYTEKGFRDNEIICIVTYDMAFGFTTDKAPMIIVFYLVKNDDSYLIKDSFDVGTSKYIVDVVNTDFVKNLYNDTYLRLSRLLASNDSLRLVYNSFRQSEMNMKSDLGPLHKKELIEGITSNKIDPIKDAKKIYDDIMAIKKDEERQLALKRYMDKVVASFSVAKRAR